MLLMRRILALLIATASLGYGTLHAQTSPPAQPNAALLNKAQTRGGVPVIVHLRTQRPLGARNIASVAERAAVIADVAQVQQRVLERMTVPHPQSIKRFKLVASFALEADEATLRALAADPEVLRVVEDIAVPAHLNG